MTYYPATAYKFDYVHKRVYEFTVNLPRFLMIDPAGHFTKLRCFAIVAFDRLAAKLGLINSHLLANVCEFLANYPII
jgi:hypothetical protein